MVGFQRYDGDVARVARAYHLEPEAVDDALAYYRIHRAEIDQLIQANEQAAQNLND